MSRSHMLFDNEPLQSIPVKPVRWETTWNPQQIFRFGLSQSGALHGGILVEGRITGKSRFSISDSQSYFGGKKWHYAVIFVEILRAVKRKYDSKTGKEIEPNFGETTKVSTGYLMSSYKTCAVGESDKLTPSEVIKHLSVPEVHKLTKANAADSRNCASFWCEEIDLENIELQNGDHIRLRTKGNGPYIDAIVKLDQQSSTASNYAGGEGTGASWTDKVMSFKGAENTAEDSISHQQGEGADDDEWDD